MPLAPIAQLTTREVAERIGRNESRVCQLLRSGELKGQKVGRDWFVSEAEVDRYLQSRPVRKPYQRRESATPAAKSS